MRVCVRVCRRCQGGDNDAEKYQEEAGQIYTTVFHKYKKNVRPPDYYPEPVPIKVHVTLIHIRGLDVFKQELQSIIDLQIQWQDKRLAWYANKVVMITEELTQVWHPSVVYLNGAVPPSPLFSSKVSISKDGMITWKRREIVTSVCPTVPHNSTQFCDVALGFTSPQTMEVFDNQTTFTIVPDFTNHHWDIVRVHVDAEDSQVLRFLLDLESLDPDGSWLGSRNCSGEVNLEQRSNGAGSTFLGGMLGSLSALSSLESEAAERQKREAKVRKGQHDRHHQTQKVKQLRKRRDELLQILQDKGSDEAGDTREERRGTDAKGARQEVTSALAYVAELRDKLQVYKMTGVSVVKTDPDSKMLCFTTSHKGVYLESYLLKLQRLTSGHFKVVHHNLPPFIAYSVLPGNLEVKDMVSAVRPVQEALAMFVLRREELKEAQKKFTDSLHVIESSAAVDYLCCHLDVGTDVQVQITLKYADLNSCLPSSVQAVLLKRGGRRRWKESLPDDAVSGLTSDFCGHRLAVALTKAAQRLQGSIPNTQADREN
ncbi:hypothetical protein ACOMHN_047219 [Nucella lapillus]